MNEQFIPLSLIRVRNNCQSLTPNLYISKPAKAFYLFWSCVICRRQVANQAHQFNFQAINDIAVSVNWQLMKRHERLFVALVDMCNENDEVACIPGDGILTLSRAFQQTKPVVEGIRGHFLGVISSINKCVML